MVTSIADSSADEIRPLRIVCLIPSATDICVHLGLQDSVVGITHCCDTDGLPRRSLSLQRIKYLPHCRLNVTSTQK